MEFIPSHFRQVLGWQKIGPRLTTDSPSSCVPLRLFSSQLINSFIWCRSQSIKGCDWHIDMLNYTAFNQESTFQASALRDFCVRRCREEWGWPRGSQGWEFAAVSRCTYIHIYIYISNIYLYILNIIYIMYIYIWGICM